MKNPSGIPIDRLVDRHGGDREKERGRAIVNIDTKYLVSPHTTLHNSFNYSETMPLWKSMATRGGVIRGTSYPIDVIRSKPTHDR